MDIPQVTTVELHGASSMAARRRPPKLKSVDRTVSMIVDNYTPLSSAALSAKNAGPLVINMDAPAMRSSPNINEQHHLYKTHSQSSSNSMDGAVGGAPSHSMEIEYQTSSLRRSSRSFQRGETIDLPSETSTSLTHLRKTPSFHSSSGDDGVKIVQLNRYHSVRHHPTTYPTTFKSHHQQQQQQIQQQQLSANDPSPHNLSARRNCSMHRSFHVPSPSQKRTIVRRDAVNKSSSFNNEDQEMHLSQQQQSHSMHLSSFQQQQQQRKHTSLEGELYRSRSNSRNNKQSLEEPLQYLEVRKPSPLPSPTMYHARSPNLSPRPSSSSSIDQMTVGIPTSPRPSTSGASSKSHITRQHTIGAINPQFLAPIPLLALDKSFENIYQAKSPVFDTKKSYSLRYKNVADRSSKDNRELFKARKSKSFISDIDPAQEFPYTLGISPALSPGLSNSGSIKKHHSPLISPSPQIRGNIIMEDIKRGSDSSDIIPPPGNFPIEFGTIDFNTIYKSYREQKGSSRRHKHRRKKASLTNSKLDDDFDSESNKKRKRIVCIVMTVFLSLVLFSILAVIVTLTHFSVAQVQNQTRQVYTFSRDSPIHYTGGGN